MRVQTLAENEMQWLGRVPPDALLEVRKTGALGEVRTILDKGVEELALANPTAGYPAVDKGLSDQHQQTEAISSRDTL